MYNTKEIEWNEVDKVGKTEFRLYIVFIYTLKASFKRWVFKSDLKVWRSVQSDRFGEWIPGGGGSNGEGSVPPGLVLDLLLKVGGHSLGEKVVNWFLREEKDFDLYSVWDGEPVQFLEEQVWVSRWAGGVPNVLEFIEPYKMLLQ